MYVSYLKFIVHILINTLPTTNTLTKRIYFGEIRFLIAKKIIMYYVEFIYNNTDTHLTCLVCYNRINI